MTNLLKYKIGSNCNKIVGDNKIVDNATKIKVQAKSPYNQNVKTQTHNSNTPLLILSEPNVDLSMILSFSLLVCSG